jgi:hypothetical protein
MSEHDFEPIRGLPGNLPEGETLLWQGAPRWLTLANQAFHMRAVGAYFLAMLAWRVCSAVIGGEPPVRALTEALTVAPIALVALGILALFAWLNSRTTVYTITNRRVVMRFGAAIPKAINIPFSIIDSAALKMLSNGDGDLALTLKTPNKIAFLHLWPHARPWQLSSPQPTFRGLPQAREVASILATAMNEQVSIDMARTDGSTRETRPMAGLGRPTIATA